MAIVDNKGRSLYCTAATDFRAGPAVIQGFVWSGATAKTDVFTLTDTAGDIIFGPILSGGMGVAADTAKPIIVMLPKPILVDGVIVSALTDGTVTIFLA